MEPPTNPLNPASLVNKFPTSSKKNQFILVGLAVVVVLAGVATGWLLSGRKGFPLGSSTAAPGAKVSSNEAGIADEKTFPDTATGEIAEGGIGGEGTHHLVRPGGEAQNVYLTSTVIDLQSFVGKKVQVWGQTIKGKKAGWLMDVGKVKVVE
jgi:hypothetical protein